MTYVVHMGIMRYAAYCGFNDLASIRTSRHEHYNLALMIRGVIASQIANKTIIFTPGAPPFLVDFIEPKSADREEETM